MPVGIHLADLRVPSRTPHGVPLAERVNSVGPRRLLKQDGWDDALNLTVSDAIAVVKHFLTEEEGFENVKVTSAVAIEGEAEWKVTADIGLPARDKKEVIVNDRDGKIISYKTA